MVTIRGHLDEMRNKCAKAAGVLVDSCEKIAGHFDEMSKAVGSESKYSSLSTAFSKMAKVHSDQQAYHEEACAAVKAEQDALDKTIRPDSVRGIIPSDVPFGSRAVVRMGQPELNKVALDGIDPRFRHLVTLQEEV